MEISVNANNMMPVVMGTGVDQTWRGQPDVVIKVPYEEWLTFIHAKKDLLTNRVPFDIKYYLENKPNINWYKVFLWDIIHSQHNEIAISSNKGLNSTIIVPTYDGDNSLSIVECINECKKLSKDSFNLALRTLQAQRPAPPVILFEALSEWNYNLFLYIVYLQHFALETKGEESKIKIDWR